MPWVWDKLYSSPTSLKLTRFKPTSGLGFARSFYKSPNQLLTPPFTVYTIAKIFSLKYYTWNCIFVFFSVLHTKNINSPFLNLKIHINFPFPVLAAQFQASTWRQMVAGWLGLPQLRSLWLGRLGKWER